MDITFPTKDGTFNFRTAAVMLHGGKVLLMHSSDAPYWYLPGGRVHIGETAETALLREMEEEVGLQGFTKRPLWLVQDFFHEVVNDEDYHEMGLYFLLDIANTDLLSRGETFERWEGKIQHIFRWVPLEEMDQLFLRPRFLHRNLLEKPAETLQFFTYTE